MDIRQLRTYVAVARLGSVTRAAEALHLSQPAISGQLKALEEELGLRLMVRTTSSVTLTQCGHHLLQKAERVLDSFADFRNAAKDYRGQIEGRLRLGIVQIDPDALRIGPLLKAIVTRHPALTIDLTAARTGWMRNAVRTSAIDGAVTLARAPIADLETVVLARMTYRVIAPIAWRERLQGADRETLADLPWIRATPQSGHQEILDHILAEAEMAPVRTAEADHEDLMRALVTGGVGIGILRSDLAAEVEAAGEGFVLPGFEATTDLVFAHLGHRAGDPVIRAVVDALSTVWDLGAAIEGMPVRTRGIEPGRR